MKIVMPQGCRNGSDLLSEGMTQEMNLILTRRNEVAQEIARTKTLLADLEKEMSELEMAGQVVARLSGAKWHEASSPDERDAAANGSSITPPARKMTLPEMIGTVLTRAHRAGRRGLEPKEIRQHIAESLDPDVKSEAVSSICWRMWKRGQLVKDEATASYSLPEKEKSAVEVRPDPTADFFRNIPHAREAERGGGT